MAIVVAASWLALSEGRARAAEPIDLESNKRTARWRPPSPDPSGIAYDPREDRLLIVDGEVDEIPRLWRGVNGWVTRRNGRVMDRFSTMSFTDEPTGIVRHPVTGAYFVTSDHPSRTYLVKPGRDGRFWNEDDDVTSIGHLVGPFRRIQARDAEGIAFGARSLWLVDGATQRLIRIRKGPDRGWAGSDQWDNVVTAYSLRSTGLTDPEGVEFMKRRRHLLVVSRQVDSDVVEVTMRGRVVRTFLGSDAGWKRPSDLALAPAVRGGGSRLYVTDRGVDNDQDPMENDGRLYRVAISLS